MITLTIRASTSQGPELCLKLPRVRWRGEGVFRAAVRGDIDNVRSLIIKGLASPLDVSSSSGLSALQYAIEYNKPEVCKTLIHAGADPYMEDKQQRNAFDLAWNKILSNSMDAKSQELLRSLFNDPEQLEKRRFPVLHKIVFGFVVKSVESELQISTATIDDVDMDGRTAISWAASRDDGVAVRALSKFGANPNITGNDGFAPIHWAARASHTSALEAVVPHGADVHCKTTHGSTPLHQAALFQDSVAFLKPLLDAGADIHARRSNGDSPLICAAEENHAVATSYLLSRGANIEDRNFDGSTALIWAISNNCHQVLDVLLAREADYRIITSTGDTLLHVAARQADIPTLERLTAIGMTGLDKYAQTYDRQTAMDLASARAIPLETWDLVFQDLLASVNPAVAMQTLKVGMVVETAELDDIDVFDDTVEYQQLPAVIEVVC
ncbi:hypothetical protein MMC25_000499 [Agyrium rufum]|nr:hypothetical protein [Agyrium rufum]